MDIENKSPIGNLRISNDVIATVAKTAALEVEGVTEISTGNTGVVGFINSSNYARPVKISMNGDKADIEVNILVTNKRPITDIAYDVQVSVKNAIQNMISLQVNRVDVVVAGIAGEPKTED